jgi:hypothetical protein
MLKKADMNLGKKIESSGEGQPEIHLEILFSFYADYANIILKKIALISYRLP